MTVLAYVVTILIAVVFTSRVWLFYDWGWQKNNYHGSQRKGEPWNQATKTGPRFGYVRLLRQSPGVSRRLIFYFPSGAWAWFDIYSRRGKSK